MTQSSLPLLTGTLPIRPYQPDGFFGTVQADGQSSKVAALACSTDGKVVLISLVGYDTSVSAVISTLWKRQSVAFAPKEGVSWRESHQLERREEGYKQFSAKLPGTREVHCAALPISTHLAEGLLHPPNLPAPEEEDNGNKTKLVPVNSPRFVLGNAEEAFPNERAFLGQLYAMRVMLLHRQPRHPEWVSQWASELWSRGLSRNLLIPLSALGINAWMLSGQLAQWNTLIADGVRAGWLPWQERA